MKESKPDLEREKRGREMEVIWVGTEEKMLFIKEIVI